MGGGTAAGGADATVPPKPTPPDPTAAEPHRLTFHRILSAFDGSRPLAELPVPAEPRDRPHPGIHPVQAHRLTTGTSARWQARHFSVFAFDGPRPMPEGPALALAGG
jgi:hypothetical protein